MCAFVVKILNVSFSRHFHARSKSLDSSLGNKKYLFRLNINFVQFVCVCRSGREYTVNSIPKLIIVQYTICMAPLIS